jgi:uncharacterized lipoprotein YmbA
MKLAAGNRTLLSGSTVLRRLSFVARLLFAFGIGMSLTGCLGFLKPSPSSARYFVLTPLPATDRPATASGTLALGVGQVKLPAYLFNTSLAVRKGTNEIVYSPWALWAERLDSGIQRVLAANLATFLHTDHVRLSAWRSEEVSAEVYVAIEQFEVGADGQGVLVARWRILSAGGESMLRAGEIHCKRQGPPPDQDPSGAVAMLSRLMGDLTCELAQAVREASASRIHR